MRLEELEIYRVPMEIAEEIWLIVIKWDYFCKKTVGDQLVRSVDSIAANVAEGYGRYHYLPCGIIV
jgi:four helix bundle protein